jgi:catalase
MAVEKTACKMLGSPPLRSARITRSGFDPDFHRRDMWDAIRSGDFPEWELGLQLFDDAFAEKFAFDILDPTKILPEEDVPVPARKAGAP